MKKLLVLLFVILGNLPIMAYDFKVNGIYYNITSSAKATVEVTYDMQHNGEYYLSTYTWIVLRNDYICTYTGKVIIPSTVDYNGITYRVTSIGDYAFATTDNRCKETNFLKGVVIPETVERIGAGAFINCKSLTDISLPNSVSTIDNNSFRGCGLDNILLPQSVSSIGGRAFDDCPMLSMTIPNNVSFIGPNAFPSTLKELIMLPFTPPAGNSFGLANAEVIVPSKSKYASNANWTSYHLIEMLTPSNHEFTYSGLSPKVSWTNNLKAYSMELTEPSITVKDAGNYSADVKVNYIKNGVLAFSAEFPFEYTIGKSPLNVKANDTNREYGEDNPKFTYTFSGFVNNENENVIVAEPSISTTATKASNVGEYPITISGGVAANYEFVYEPGILTVTKAPLTAKINDVTRIYGAGNPAFTVNYNGLKNGEAVPKWSESLKIETTATAQSDVGAYNITALGKPVNYDLPHIMPGTLTVVPAPLTIKANDASRFYFEPNPEFECSYSGFVNNDDKQVITKTPVFNTDATQTSNVGNYEVTPSGAEAKNYVIAYEPGVLTVNKRSLTATANPLSREYGEENPVLTIFYEGFMNNEDESVLSEQPNITTSATKYSNAGTYDINLTGGVSTNYSLTLNPGVLTVNKAPLTVIVNDATREYGDENPTLTLHYEGLKLDEKEPKLEKQISITTSASANSPVGEYAINASGGTATNYQISYNAGKLSITPATLTVTALSKFRKYGEENPVFDYSTSPTKQSTDKFTTLPTLTCTATQASPIGKYDIVVSGAVMPNYEINYVDGTMTVGKGKLKISANSYSRLYGEENPTFDVTYSGFANNESEEILTVKPTVTCSATKASNAGQYPILVSGGEANNYELSYNDGMLSIGKCRLSISTKDYSRRYGEENPEFEISYQGFIEGENESNLLKKPDITCEANSLTNIGEYPIIISGAESDNYLFDYNNGKLIITIAEQEIVWEQDFESENFQVGDQIELQAYATSGLPIYYELSDNNIASLYSANGKVYLDCLQEGTLVIRALQEGNNNYYTAVRKSKILKIGDASGIESISVDALSSNAPVYDLIGNRVKVLIKGRIYIQNRKKYIAK